MNSNKLPLDELLRKAKTTGNKLLAVLIDPDKPGCGLDEFVKKVAQDGADIILLGGSLIMQDMLETCIKIIRQHCSLPIYIFPSGVAHIKSQADGILFLSLISGRNADLLIGKHVEAAPLLAKTDLHVMSTGYMLIDCGNVTTAHYMSQSNPIPYEKSDIAQATALAGQYLGMSLIYLDGGSGAHKTVSPQMIERVSTAIEVPLIVGGGIRSAGDAEKLCKAGADMIVVGNALERDPGLLQDISIAVHSTGAFAKSQH